MDAGLLRSPQSATVEVARRLRRKTNLETPGNSGPASSRFYAQSLRSESSTKAMDPGSTIPSWRSGNTHGFCVTGGHSPIASEPTPSPRLWATAPGATPVRLCEHTMRIPQRALKTGTFYFGGNRNFLLWSDMTFILSNTIGLMTVRSLIRWLAIPASTGRLFSIAESAGRRTTDQTSIAAPADAIAAMVSPPMPPGFPDMEATKPESKAPACVVTRFSGPAVEGELRALIGSSTRPCVDREGHRTIALLR